MLVKVQSAGVLGIEAYAVEAQVDVASGLPQYAVVGLAAGAVKEGGVRVPAALKHSGFRLPPSRITINLAPADVRKDGAAFDLPIALGLLASQELLPTAALEGVMVLGELSLDGTIRRVAGALPVAMCAQALGARTLVLPRDCADEAAAVSQLTVYAASTLPEVVAFLRGECSLPRARFVRGAALAVEQDLSEVRGLEAPRRALEVAAAGGHNLLFLGPPGSGDPGPSDREPTRAPASTA